MSINAIELQIAAQSVQGIPKGEPLTDRLKYAMRYVIEHESDVLWMSARSDDDLMFRASLAAVILGGDEADKEIITRSLQPLRMLSALLSGIPVDLDAMEKGDDLIPLMKLWHEVKAEVKAKVASD